MPSTLLLSANELRDLTTDDDLQEITELLLDHPDLQPIYLHFCSLSRTIRRLEEMQRDTQDDLEKVFEDMTRLGLDDAFAFLIARRRREQALRATPYSCPSSPRRHTGWYPRIHRVSSSDSLTSFFTPPSSPSPNPNDIERQPHLDDEPPLGPLKETLPPESVTNSIDGDCFPTPVSSLETLRQSSRSPTQPFCPWCQRSGHNYDDCLWKYGVPRGRPRT